MIRPWWERIPKRLDYELEKLRELGITCEPKFEGDIVSLEFEYDLHGEKIPLIIKFPCSYPYLRFTVEAPSLKLDHHQNPFTKDLCIIGRSTINWETDDTVAATLKTQMPKVISAGTIDNLDEVKDLEEAQPEPVSAYFGTDGFVFIDGEFNLGNDFIGQWGNLEIGIHKDRIAVIGLNTMDDRTLVEANTYIKNIFTNRISGRWIRIDKPIIENDRQEFYKKLISIEPGFKIPRWQNFSKKLDIDIVAIIFPEEVGQRIIGEGWLFFVRVKR